MSLCEHVGGPDAIRSATKVFYDYVHKDPLVSGYFKNIDMSKQIEKTANFIVHAAGGNEPYKYRDLKEVHANLGITKAQFDSAWTDMEKSLDDHKMNADQKKRMK